MEVTHLKLDLTKYKEKEKRENPSQMWQE